jgi:hypothetical protein
MIHTRPRAEVMAAAHHHHNADRKVDVWACQVDRACVERVPVCMQHGVGELCLGRHWVGMAFVDVGNIDKSLINTFSS